jgi:heme/copper-type cytochrome/quinol oxidase subunit 3
MALFILVEAALFSLLLSSYFYLLADAPAWPPPGIAKPDLLLPGIGTVLLLGSSVPMVWATKAASRGRFGEVEVAMVISIVLAVAFLAIQGWSLAHADFSARDNAYGSVFFTVELTHAAHLVLGLLLVSMALIRVFLRHFTAERHLAIETSAMYWHFVDVVWIFVFLSLHISPYVFAP